MCGANSIEVIIEKLETEYLANVGDGVDINPHVEAIVKCGKDRIRVRMYKYIKYTSVGRYEDTKKEIEKEAKNWIEKMAEVLNEAVREFEKYVNDKDLRIQARKLLEKLVREIADEKGYNISVYADWVD